MQYIVSVCSAHVHHIIHHSIAYNYVNLWIVQSDYSIALTTHVCPDDPK